MALQYLQNEYTQLFIKSYTLEAQNLKISIESIKERYHSDPRILYSDMRDTISFENEVFGLPYNIMPESENEIIHSILQRLQFWLISIENTMQEGYHHGYSHDHDMWFLTKKLHLLSNMNEIILLKITDCLNRWKMHQKTFKTDPLYEGDEGLELIQKMYREFVEIILTTRSFMEKNTWIGNQMQELSKRNANLFQKMIDESILFDIQPPRVLKTRTT